VYITPFWEDRFTEIVKMVGTDRVLSDPTAAPRRPEGPISFVDELSDFGAEDVAKIMGGNLMELMKVAKPVSA